MRFRPAALALAALLVVAGCDSSNPGGNLADLDGEYRVDELVFDPSSSAVADADVAASLDLAATKLQIFAGDGSATLITRRAGTTTSVRSEFTATAARGRLTLAARTTEDRDELAALLLPSSISLTYEPASPTALSGDLTLSSVDLEAFDAERYRDLPPLSGTLRVRFSRQ